MSASGFPWRDLAELQGVPLAELRPRDDEVREQARDALAEAWQGIQELKAAVATLEEAVAPALHEMIPRRPGWAQTPAGIVKRSKRGGSTHWDHEEAVTDVVGAAPPAEPEAFPWAGHPDLELETVDVTRARREGAAAVEQAAGFAYWRVGVLRELGLDPDDYRDVVRARPWVSRA